MMRGKTLALILAACLIPAVATPRPIEDEHPSAVSRAPQDRAPAYENSLKGNLEFGEGLPGEDLATADHLDFGTDRVKGGQGIPIKQQKKTYPSSEIERAPAKRSSSHGSSEDGRSLASPNGR